MAAEVFGTITGAEGTKDFSLNNAATEATLKALLAATAKSEKGIEKAMALASKAGLNPAAIQNTNDSLQRLAIQSAGLDTELGETEKKSKSLNLSFSNLSSITNDLITGSASLSGVLSKMSGFFPGVTGRVLAGFSELAKFQEASVNSYRTITDSGASFNGSLTDMRLAAASSYLTLDEFEKMIKSNSTVFANMGGTVSQSTKSFSAFANDFIKGDLGIGLMNLGYSFEDLNQGALNYIAISGGMNMKEMADKEQLGQRTAAYLEQLDRIAAITGKSRKQQEDDLKKLALTPVWENYIAKLKLVDPNVSKRMTAALTEVEGQFGLQAGRVFQARQMNQIGMLNSADRAYMAITESAGASFIKYTDYVKTGVGNLNDISSDLTYSLGNASGQFDGISGVLSATSSNMSEVVNSTMKANTAQLNLTDANGRALTREEFIAKRRDANAEQNDKRVNAEITAANQSSLAIKNLGINILDYLEKPLKRLSSVLNLFAEHIVGLGVTLVGLIGAAKLLSSFLSFTGAGAGAGPAAGLVKIFGERGHFPTKPLFVYVVNQGGSGILPGAPGGAGAGIGGMVGTLSKVLKFATIADLGFTAISDISKIMSSNKELSDGKITKEEANKQKGGAIGDLLGTGVGMGTGMLIGRIVGAAIGSLAGPIAPLIAPALSLGLGAAGGKIGEMTGEWLAKPTKPESETRDVQKSENETRLHNLAILKEQQEQTKMMAALLDISAAHYEIDKGTAPHLENLGNGQRSWVFGR